jgi:hypothetical protein
MGERAAVSLLLYCTAAQAIFSCCAALLSVVMRLTC